MREAISVFTENANNRQKIGGRELGEAHILHPERLFLQPLHSQNVFYGNAAKSALSWRLKKHKGEKIFNTEMHEKDCCPLLLTAVKDCKKVSPHLWFCGR